MDASSYDDLLYLGDLDASLKHALRGVLSQDQLTSHTACSGRTIQS